MRLYRLLKVQQSATVKEIKTAYRQLALELHPDVNEGNEAKTLKFRDVAQAYETLSNPTLRREYDRTLEKGAVFNRPSYQPETNYNYNPTVADIDPPNSWTPKTKYG
jgi:DnaJ-class molecular chaperone